MSIKQSSCFAERNRRLEVKTIHQQMAQLAINGAGLSPWEADELVKIIDDVYFSNNNLSDISNGQIKYSCVSSEEGAGKPLSQCKMVTVVLSLLKPEDNERLPNAVNKQRQVNLRWRRVMRVCDEAKDQGGLLSQEDLAELLMCDVKTIQRDCIAMQKDGIVIPTRGQQKDIGPGVTHRELVVRHWIEGKEPVAVADCTKHSIKAVENYLDRFKVVVYLRKNKSFTDHEISVVAGISPRAVKTYLELFNKYKNSSLFKYRLEEITIAGSNYYQSVGEKKDLSQ